MSTASTASTATRPSRAALLLGLVSLLAACTSERDVLVEGLRAPITACESAWTRGWPGAPCSFDKACIQETRDGCCVGVAACRGGKLDLQTSCSCSDTACKQDSDCTYGITWCQGGVCAECPHKEGMCPPCPIGFERRIRNGCETCTCTPVNQCELGAPCSRVPAGVCYPGDACAPGCDPAQPGCCANACAEKGCTSPAPLGCRSTECPGGCATCMTIACECYRNAEWRCTSACIDTEGAACVYK